MPQLKPGLLVMIYGLNKNVELNGKMVTIRSELHYDLVNFIRNNTPYPKDQKWWVCDDGFFYMSKNLMPIGNTDPDLEMTYNKDIETTMY